MIERGQLVCDVCGRDLPPGFGSTTCADGIARCWWCRQRARRVSYPGRGRSTPDELQLVEQSELEELRT